MSRAGRKNYSFLLDKILSLDFGLYSCGVRDRMVKTFREEFEMKKYVNAFEYAGEICKALPQGILMTTAAEGRSDQQRLREESNLRKTINTLFHSDVGGSRKGRESSLYAFQPLCCSSEASEHTAKVDIFICRVPCPMLGTRLQGKCQRPPCGILCKTGH